jgi:hypothetical protein
MWVIVFFTIIMGGATTAWAHSGGLNNMGCHKNSKTGDHHCHKGSLDKPKIRFGARTALNNENSFNQALSAALGGETEVSLKYSYGRLGNLTLSASVRVDIVTDKYVIEGGLDKRSSLDSIQQAVFASSLVGKQPAVAIYDTDGVWGKYEHRIWAAANALGIRFIWFDGNRIKER